jgi:4-oxalocrotonate tautomerase
MPFANIKVPQAALSKAQKEEIVHRVTDMFVEYFSEAARQHIMVLIEEVTDGGYGRADEVFVIPDAYRAKDDSRQETRAGSEICRTSNHAQADHRRQRISRILDWSGRLPIVCYEAITGRLDYAGVFRRRPSLRGARAPHGGGG